MARKGTKKNSDDEERVLAAVKAYRSEKFKNIRDAAMAHDITYGKLRNRLASVQSKTHSHIYQQALTPPEEKAIVAWIIQLDIWGFPPRRKYVKDLATNYVRSHGVKNPNLGVNWTTRFLTRHQELESKFVIRLDKQRGFANNPNVIKDFFKKVKL